MNEPRRRTRPRPTRKLSPEEQKQVIARYLADPGFVARMREAYEARLRGEKGVPFRELIDKSKNGGA